MKFAIQIDCDHAAFRHEDMGDAPSPAFATVEVARILRDVERRVCDGNERGLIFDVNGNRVGSFGFSTTPAEGAGR
jgi:hypothetical protein